MVSCAACGCSKTPKNTDLGITFHRFPKDADKREAWMRVVHRANWEPTKNCFLCSEHFAPDSFDRTSNLKVRLHPSAIPTIQVDRLKNVRSFPKTYKRPAEIPDNEDVMIPGPSASTPNLVLDDTPPMSTPNLNSDDTPKKKQLKRKILRLESENRLKSYKIRRLQKKSWYQRRQITSLRSMVGHLKKINLLVDDQEHLFLEQFGENQNVIQRLFKKSRGQRVSKIYDQSIRSFAITLHFFSPKAYSYVRQKFKNCLPHPKTLSKWYSSVNAEPGFTTESFNFLKIKVSHTNYPLVCSLVFDEMSIRQHVQFDGKNYHGYVDFGNALHGDGVDLAKDVLVFMIVCLNESWKLPLGYFFVAGLKAEQKAVLTRQCLSLLRNTGITITNVTFDGCAANISMCKILGCSFEPENLNTSFYFEEKIHFVLPDPAHMVKLIRNCFGEMCRIINGHGNIIDFEYVKKLNELQVNEGLHLGNKLRSQHINFFKQKMKVKLATQLLSRSVADSLMYCKDNLKLKEFENCEATAQFIYFINDAFDILNSRKLSLPNYKKAACASNIGQIEEFFITFKNYICQLKCPDSTYVVNSNRKTGFLGFLIGLKTLLGMWSEYVKRNKVLSYIPMYKCSQDHLELFFSSVRSQGGYNNNPTCRQFTSAYKKLVIHAEVRDGGAGNCIPLEEITILNTSSSLIKAPEEIINASLPHQKRINEITETECETITFLQEHNYALNLDSLSPYSSEVVTYIAGFVSFKLGKKLKCEQCISELYGNKDNFLNSLISFKSYGYLKYPSDDVISICIKAEKWLRIEKSVNVKINKQKIISEVLKYFHLKPIFIHMANHDTNLISHYVFLIKSIANSYLDTRIHFICRNVQSNVERIRSQMTKLVTFKGQ